MGIVAFPTDHFREDSASGINEPVADLYDQGGKREKKRGIKNPFDRVLENKTKTATDMDDAESFTIIYLENCEIGLSCERQLLRI